MRGREALRDRLRTGNDGRPPEVLRSPAPSAGSADALLAGAMFLYSRRELLQRVVVDGTIQDLPGARPQLQVAVQELHPVAISTSTPRFIAILRERCNLPLWIQAFVGLDMTPRKTMELRETMRRLVKRLKKQPHER